MFCVIHQFGLYSFLPTFLCCNSSGKQSIELNSVLLGWMKPAAFNFVRKRGDFLRGWLFVVVCVWGFFGRGGVCFEWRYWKVLQQWFLRAAGLRMPPVPSIRSPLAVGQRVLVLAPGDSREQTFSWNTGTISFFSNIVIETDMLCNGSRKS